MKPGAPPPRYPVMKLAIFALTMFVLGVAPGLLQYAGPPPQAPARGRPLQQTENQVQQSLLTRFTETMKLKL